MGKSRELMVLVIALVVRQFFKQHVFCQQVVRLYIRN